MATAGQCLASLARLNLCTASRPALRPIPRFLAPSLASGAASSRGYAKKPNPNRLTSKELAERAARKEKALKKKRRFKDFRQSDLSQLEQFTLCDAIR
jgi:large subunit ribosomal protein L1